MEEGQLARLGNCVEAAAQPAQIPGAGLKPGGMPAARDVLALAMLVDGNSAIPRGGVGGIGNSPLPARAAQERHARLHAGAAGAKLGHEQIRPPLGRVRLQPAVAGKGRKGLPGGFGRKQVREEELPARLVAVKLGFPIHGMMVSPLVDTILLGVIGLEAVRPLPNRIKQPLDLGLLGEAGVAAAGAVLVNRVIAVEEETPPVYRNRVPGAPGQLVVIGGRRR